MFVLFARIHWKRHAFGSIGSLAAYAAGAILCLFFVEKRPMEVGI